MTALISLIYLLQYFYSPGSGFSETVRRLYLVLFCTGIGWGLFFLVLLAVVPAEAESALTIQRVLVFTFLVWTSALAILDLSISLDSSAFAVGCLVSAVLLRTSFRLYLTVATPAALVTLVGVARLRPGLPIEITLPLLVYLLVGLFAALTLERSAISGFMARTELKRSNEELRRLSFHDDLTGLYNRRYMLEVVSIFLRQLERKGTSFGVLMIDVDYFKRINDSLGHHAGDNILCELGGRIGGAIRAADVAGRFGGEEFLIILPQTPAEMIPQVAERIRGVIGGEKFSEVPWQVTVSVGWTIAEAGDDTVGLIKRADSGLYAAKNGGRNRVARG